MNDGQMMKQHLMAKQKILTLTENFHVCEFYTREKSICTVFFNFVQKLHDLFF